LEKWQERGIQHDQYGIVLDRAWVEQRLEAAFERKW
jgi:hypothetical protein